MTEQTSAEAYLESCMIDLSKQLTAAEKRIEQMEKGFKDILSLDNADTLVRMIAKACIAGAIDQNGKYCFVPEPPKGDE